MADFNRNQVADINRNARPNSSESARKYACASCGSRTASKSIAVFALMSDISHARRYGMLHHSLRTVASMYRLIFGAAPHRIFPKYAEEIEDLVMRNAHALYERLKDDPSQEALSKRKLLENLPKNAASTGHSDLPI